MRNLRLKNAYVEFAQQYKPNYFITLATNQFWPAERMRCLIGKFFRRLDYQALGRKCHKQPPSLRADGVSFIEKPGVNTHAHCIVRVPYEMGDAPALWGKLCPSGSVDIQSIYTEGFGAYCAKEFELDQHSDEQVVLLSDFMSATSLRASNT